MFHDNLTQNFFKAKILTQKFITSYKIDPKIYIPAKKSTLKNGTSRIPIYGSYHPEILYKYNLRDFFQKKFMSRTIKHKKSLCPVLGSIKKGPCPVPQNTGPILPINNEQSLTTEDKHSQ